MNNMDVPPGITVFCDPTLRPVVHALGAQAGFPVAALSAPAPLMIAQIVRHTRNDVLFTLADAMDQATQLNLMQPATRVDGFRNTLVLAALQNFNGNITGARVAVTDATVASGLDGKAVLSANNVMPESVQGVANTADVVFLVTIGAADIGLMYLTDVKADARLKVLAPMQADPRLITYAAAVNAHALSPNAPKFVDMLRGAGVALSAGGLVPA